MKSLYLFCLMLLSGIFTFAQVKVSQSGGAPAGSAMFEIESSSAGFLPPRMTTLERDGITNPAEGLIIFNMDSGCPNYFFGGEWYAWCGSLPIGTITGLDCDNAINSGTLTDEVTAAGVSSVIAYTGGNGIAYAGQSVTSTGVSGLTATLGPGTFANGSGTVSYTITGTPTSSGNATFALNLGGQACSLVRNVGAAPFNGSNCGLGVVSFTYNGELVTYGTVAGANGRCWLDRNLGALQVSSSSTDVNSFGDLFQWGRGDDGHQSRSSGTLATLSSTNTPGHGFFITSTSAPDDWINPQNANLWQGVNGVNNPCPTGWNIPTGTEWETERDSWTNGQNTVGAFASPLKLSLAGYRPGNGVISETGNLGGYWTSATSSSSSREFVFNSSIALLSVSARVTGYSVRCIKD
jgi:uncharacterized protein (TIGR02145 family)